jgi:lipopolysaccharide/colanic/teichoic acid biosynthesis glycosyltransferase
VETLTRQMLGEKNNNKFMDTSGKNAFDPMLSSNNRTRPAQGNGTFASGTDVIHVFCPSEFAGKLGKVLAQHQITCRLNDFSVDLRRGQKIFHYQSERLPVDTCTFLVAATGKGVWVEPLEDYLDRRLGATEIALLDHNYFLHKKAFSVLSCERYALQKRGMDLILAVLVGFFSLPLMLLVALVIRLDSGGPVFYQQERVGRYGKPFTMIKFRTMCVGAERDGARWAGLMDDRVTRAGIFLRKYRIDELPQLINVFRGEMSMIGPRPERQCFVDVLQEHIPFYGFRHCVKPGITGLAQVRYPYGSSVEDARWKHKYDIYYIKNRTLWLDLKIVMLTIKTVLIRIGR